MYQVHNQPRVSLWWHRKSNRKNTGYRFPFFEAGASANAAALLFAANGSFLRGLDPALNPFPEDAATGRPGVLRQTDGIRETAPNSGRFSGERGRKFGVSP